MVGCGEVGGGGVVGVGGGDWAWVTGGGVGNGDRDYTSKTWYTGNMITLAAWWPQQGGPADLLRRRWFENKSKRSIYVSVNLLVNC